MSSIEFYNEVMKVQKSIRVKVNKSKNNNKNIIVDNLDSDIIDKLEKIRRGEWILLTKAFLLEYNCLHG